MPHSSKTLETPGPTSFALGFIVLCLVVFLLHQAAAIMIPFVIAVFVWYLINAIARGLGRMKFRKKSLPRTLCFVLAQVLLVAGIWFVYKLISVNAADVIRAAPVYQKKFTDFLSTVLTQLPEGYRPSLQDAAGFLDVGGFITALVKTFSGVAGKTLVVLFYTGFLLYEQRFFGRKLKEMAGGKEREQRVHAVVRNIESHVQRYILVKTAVSVTTGISTWLLLLIFDIDFAPFWGVMACILTFIQYVGPFAAVVLPSIVAVVQLGSFSQGVMVLYGLCLIHIFWDGFVDRRIEGTTMTLSPIFIVFSLAAWAMIWGVPGMFLSVPILAMITIILAQFPSTRPLSILMTKTGELDEDRHERKTS